MWSENGIRETLGVLFGQLVFIGSTGRMELPFIKIKNAVGKEGGMVGRDQELDFECLKLEMSIRSPSGYVH